MSKAPQLCRYCDGTGDGPEVHCGFCVAGIPLDTQDDWDRTWGHLFEVLERMRAERNRER